MRILVLANSTPWPPRGGPQLRIRHLLERIAGQHEVVLGCHMWSDADRDGVAELNRRGLRTVGGMIRFPPAQRWLLNAALHGLQGLPPETVKMQAPELHQLVRDGAYDLLQVEETILAPYFRSMPHDRQRHRVLTLHNVHFLQDLRLARIEPSLRWQAWRRFNALWMRFYEPGVAAAMDRVITMSADDSVLLQGRAPGVRAEVIPNGVDTHALVPLPPTEGPPALVFVGSMMYRPCVDAAVWLVREILPLVRRTHPGVEVWIVGRGPAPEVTALAGDGVFVTGEVEDVAPYYRRATLAVVPLRAGGGTRLKILEAMALGRVVVSTTVGAEGLRVDDDTHLALADDAPSLANAIVALLNDRERRDRLARAARALVETEYDWDRIAAAQLAVYEGLERASSRESTALDHAGSTDVPVDQPRSNVVDSHHR
jgi:glycosyltransferase involved in cell wall biosynthesis